MSNICIIFARELQQFNHTSSTRPVVTCTPQRNAKTSRQQFIHTTPNHTRQLSLACRVPTHSLTQASPAMYLRPNRLCIFDHYGFTDGASAEAATDSCRKVDLQSWLQAARTGKSRSTAFFFECMKNVPVLLCFSLCASRPNLCATTRTSLLSVGFFGLQTLQFAAQGDDLVGFALIVFL